MQQKLTEIVRIATLIGEILLKNGAETFRVEDTMERVAKACGAYRVDTFVTPTGVFISIRQENGKTLTGLKRIKKRRISLDRIAKVNEVSRALVEERIDYDTALDSLHQISKAKTTFSWFTAILASGVVGSGTAIIQNGGFGEVIVAFFAAALSTISIIFFIKSSASLAEFAIEIAPNLPYFFTIPERKTKTPVFV